MNSQSLLRFSIGAALVSSMLFLVFNVLRLTFVANIIYPFLILNSVVLASIAAVGLYHWRKLSISRLEWLIIGAVLLSTALANYAGRESIDIITDIARPLLFISVIITVRHCLNMESFGNSPTIKKLLPACIWATVAGVIICCVVDGFIKGIYPAYSSIDSVLGMGWLMATGGSAAPLLFLLILVVSGKRAVYLAAAAVMLVLYRNQPRMMWAVVAIVVTGLIVSAINVRHYAPGSYHDVAEYYSGGRLDEIQDAIKAVPSPAHYITGMGPGFAYPSELFSSKGALHRNLHFTPLCLIIYYGVIFSGLFAYYILRMLPAAWGALNDKSNPVRMSYAVYFFASLPFALTEYNVFSYANCAIACGLMMATQKTPSTAHQEST